jgi:DNA-binding GntR family transcriptional regulator
MTSSNLHNTCSIDILTTASEYLGRNLVAVRAIIEKVAVVMATWRESEKGPGALLAQINRIANASEQDDFKRTFAL